jgi:NAD(P)-dependent dehydrogenase (short-subunit alcohol dehydrogenase family)
MTSSNSELASVRSRVALVTGGSAGLGAAIACALAQNGWHVIAASRSAGSEYLDVTRETSIHAALAHVAERGLTLDAAMPVNDMAARIVNRALTGRGFRKRFGLDALWMPIAKQLLPESVFFSIARRNFGM